MYDESMLFKLYRERMCDFKKLSFINTYLRNIYWRRILKDNFFFNEIINDSGFLLRFFHLSFFSLRFALSTSGKITNQNRSTFIGVNFSRNIEQNDKFEKNTYVGIYKIELNFFK